MTSTHRLLLYSLSDQPIKFRAKTVPGGSTPLSLTGAALKFVVEDKAGNRIASKTSAAGQITIANGVEDDGVTPTGGTDDMATVTLTTTDLGVPPGTDYAGALWRTDVNSAAPYWEGPITIKRAPAR